MTKLAEHHRLDQAKAPLGAEKSFLGGAFLFFFCFFTTCFVFGFLFEECGYPLRRHELTTAGVGPCVKVARRRADAGVP